MGCVRMRLEKPPATPARSGAAAEIRAEYDNTIRDLTGVDLRPAREFPVDPANEAGFDNSGESLAMSPALVEKYLAAARRVADHLVLESTGFAFAPIPWSPNRPRQVLCPAHCRLLPAAPGRLRRLLSGRLAIPVPASPGKASASLRDIANEAKLSDLYLARIWDVLTIPPRQTARWARSRRCGESYLPVFLSLLATRHWSRPGGLRANPRPGSRLRKTYQARANKVYVKGISDGSQPLVLWWNHRVAGLRMRSGSDADPPDVKRFCKTFPDTFFVSERPPYSDPNSGIKGRLLTAGFHLMQGHFRDDTPLCELVLDDAGRRELDGLWWELDFVTLAPMRQYKDFIFFERGEPPRFMMEPTFNFARSEDKDAITDAKIGRLHAAYLAKVRRIGAKGDVVKAIEEYFTEVTAAIRKVEQARQAAEPTHLEARSRSAGPGFPAAPLGRGTGGFAHVLSRSAHQGRPEPRGCHPRFGRQRPHVASFLLPR